MASGGFLLPASIAFLGIAIWFNASDFKPEEYALPPPPQLTGPLALNKPKNAKKLLEGELIGPESIVVEKNTLYTCTMDGKCLKIVDGKIRKVVPMSEHKDCHALTRQTYTYCGRPLGIRRHNANQFIVIDCMLGLFAINFEKGTRELLFSSETAVDGKKMKFPDDFDFVDNDTIVFSDASTRFGYSDFLMPFLEHIGDGRIIQYKLSTGRFDVLVDGLTFPNGVQTHPDGESVLFCESSMARVHRYYFAGPKKGRREVFADNLPGLPDNIRISASGKSLYVALFSHRSAAQPNDFFQWAGAWPMLRKFIGEMIKILPSPAIHIFFAHSHSAYGIVVELDLNGNVIRSYHDPDGHIIKDISQVADDGGDYLYLASFNNKYIGRINKH